MKHVKNNNKHAGSAPSSPLSSLAMKCSSPSRHRDASTRPRALPLSPRPIVPRSNMAVHRNSINNMPQSPPRSPNFSTKSSCMVRRSAVVKAGRAVRAVLGLRTSCGDMAETLAVVALDVGVAISLASVRLITVARPVARPTTSTNKHFIHFYARFKITENQ